jgi:hypothetical protein
LAVVFATFDCFAPFVFCALVGVPSAAAGAATVLRTLFFCALPGAVLLASLGGIVVEEKRAVWFFFGSGVFESDQLGGLSPSNQCPANCRVCVEIAPLQELCSSIEGT